MPVKIPGAVPWYLLFSILLAVITKVSLAMALIPLKVPLNVKPFDIKLLSINNRVFVLFIKMPLLVPDDVVSVIVFTLTMALIMRCRSIPFRVLVKLVPPPEIVLPSISKLFW